MFSDLLFPRRCLGCGQSGQYFCEDCLKKIKLVGKQVCPVCKRSAINGKTHSRCQTRYSLDGLISIFVYQGMIRQAISKLKYKFATDLAEELIALSIKRLLSGFKPKTFRIIIPIPLHSRRQRWRGFNQAELLGGMLAEKFDWLVRTDVLVRYRHTKPQMGLKGKERKRNIKGVFKTNPEFKINNLKSEVLLFDDVWTTGSTLREAGQMLKRAGVKEIWGLTIAR